MEPTGATDPFLMSAMDMAWPLLTAVVGGIIGGGIGWKGALANSKRQEYNVATQAVREGLEAFLAAPTDLGLHKCPRDPELTKMLANLANRDRRRITPAVDHYRSALEPMMKHDEWAVRQHSPEDLQNFIAAAKNLRSKVEVR
ncbi:hypothetical protein F0A17_02000 [Billgrantia pellis]|uniref:Uncharacterized protein n=1 Tax=Billgrantia pellis TaxID=2606936 RepID=A0A7V7KHM6_9GAMM|nr:hypothetical protein [Halomonas pellis]KAA0014447.1 hypothetical protein F0A17_02000 [Halomonas pellis]